MASASAAPPSSSSSSSGPAPWRAAFLKNVNDMASPEFTLATLHSAPAAVSAVPRLRTVIFRGLWAELPVNPKNTAPLNPPVYESDLLTLTTDARMAKVPDLFGPSSSSFSSGGGGPVEACFWTGAKVQWRVRGEAHVLGPDVEHPGAPGPAAVREALQARMRRRRRRREDLPPEGDNKAEDDDDDDDWSFAREVTAHFGNLSPAMRGTFRNPEPGTPRGANSPPDDGKLGLGHKVEDLHDEVARANFRVVVVVPAEVDETDLSDPEDPRRWLYRFVGASADDRPTDGAERSNGWEKIELWP
ncbi:hypothetical protein LZ31DRAFT_558641 [Colletotrichum somersetense]|nr:hypothetical protein LZ31DRAFT_558641 [Colletotrichum somersetense]